MGRRLDGQVGIVTGAESGIGRAIAKALSAEGAKLVCTYLSDEKAAKDAKSELESEALYVQTDVSDEAAVDRLFERCQADFGLPSILVNSAGINGHGIRVADMSLNRWRKVLDANLTGPFLTCRRFAKDAPRLGGRGKIVNVTSIHEDIAVAGEGEYCASKGGLRNLTRCLALELAEYGVCVNNIAPGMILTPMNEEAVENPELRKERAAHIPLRRAGQPEEVAQLALYLALPESDYATGSTFFLDGGLRLNLGQGA